MRGRYFRTVLCLVALVLLVPIVVGVVGCSSGGGKVAMMDKLPKDAGEFTFTDIAALRGDDDLKDGYDEFEAQIEDSYDFLGIDPDDVDRICEGGGIMILEGKFDLEDVRDELENNDYNDDTYKGVETWENDYSYYEAVALVDDGCIVVGDSIGSVEDCIKVIKGEDDSLSEDRDISAVAGKLPKGIYVYVSTTGEATYYEDCKAVGTSVQKKDSDTAKMTVVFLFDDDGAAEDAMEDIEDTYKDEYDFDNVKVTQDGEFVIVTCESDIG